MTPPTSSSPDGASGPESPPPSPLPLPRPGLGEVFLRFLKLGCIAFGGPVAHIGFFEEEFVRRRRWLGAEEFADLMALCQFLPGPASSQMGFAIGRKAAGVPGAVLAWVGFTLPAAVVMIGFGLGLAALEPEPGAGWIVGLKLAAVAVVANAVWNLGIRLCPDRARALLAIAAATVLLVTGLPLLQVGVIAVGAGVGWLFLGDRARTAGDPEAHLTAVRSAGWPYLLAFAVLLAGLPLAAAALPDSTWAAVEAFYRAGALVFGGGHVVLPLLDAFTVGPGWVSSETFLAGYGLAQAIPGPMFTFTAFLGTVLAVGPGGVAGGLLALVATYLPALLLVLGLLPSWDRVRTYRAAQAALAGTNAAVVGLLLAAFYQPVWTAAVTGPERAALALVAFGLLRFVRIPPWAVVAGCAGVGGLWL